MNPLQDNCGMYVCTERRVANRNLLAGSRGRATSDASSNGMWRRRGRDQSGHASTAHLVEGAANIREYHFDLHDCSLLFQALLAPHSRRLLAAPETIANPSDRGWLE